MRTELKSKAVVYPMPVLMIATYDENGKVDVMNAAWGMICEPDKIFLSLSESHKTVKNLKITKAFTVSLADAEHVKEADFFGIASGNTMEDKFERSGLTASKSEKVNAPVIEEFPVTMECELAETVETDNVHAVIGKIVRATADEKVLGEDGQVDVSKSGIMMFDPFRLGYYVTGEKAGTAWNSGKELMD